MATSFFPANAENANFSFDILLYLRGVSRVKQNPRCRCFVNVQLKLSHDCVENKYVKTDDLQLSCTKFVNNRTMNPRSFPAMTR